MRKKANAAELAELHNLTLKQAVPRRPQVAERKKQKLPANTQRTARCQEVAQYPMSIDDHKDTLRLIFTDLPLYQNLSNYLPMPNFRHAKLWNKQTVRAEQAPP